MKLSTLVSGHAFSSKNIVSPAYQSQNSYLISPEAPSGWSVHYDPVLQEFYYVNNQTGVSQLDHPEEQIHIHTNERKHKRGMSPIFTSHKKSSPIMSREFSFSSSNSQQSSHSRHRSFTFKSRDSSSSISGSPRSSTDFSLLEPGNYHSEHVNTINSDVHKRLSFPHISFGKKHDRAHSTLIST